MIKWDKDNNQRFLSKLMSTTKVDLGKVAKYGGVEVDLGNLIFCVGKLTSQRRHQRHLGGRKKLIWPPVATYLASRPTRLVRAWALPASRTP